MTVKKTSWHYRLWRLGRENDLSEPRDLCRYFWHIFLLKILAPATLVALALTGIGALIWLVWGHPVESGLIVLASAVGIALILGIFLATKRYYEKTSNSRYERRLERRVARQQKEPSVVWAYLKARKRRMCPLIDVVDDRKLGAPRGE